MSSRSLVSPLNPSSGRRRGALRSVLRPRVVVPVVVVAAAAAGAVQFIGNDVSSTSAATSKVQGWPADGADVSGAKLAATTVRIPGAPVGKVTATLDGQPVQVSAD